MDKDTKKVKYPSITTAEENQKNNKKTTKKIGEKNIEEKRQTQQDGYTSRTHFKRVKALKLIVNKKVKI